MSLTFRPTPTPTIASEAAQTAAAVVDLLNDGTISLPTPAERQYLPLLELDKAGDTSVIVIATGRSLEWESRSGRQAHVQGQVPSVAKQKRFVMVEVGVSEKFDKFNDPKAADSVLSRCEQVANLLSSVSVQVKAKLTAYPMPDGEIPSCQHSPLYDPGLWKTNHQFTGIVRINYRLMDG